ncbi:MAG TPA: condensation domain-containing protein, partial [Thermoanaerobaculia bacterium]|nr:condensation domain-containing protein [Thermoanaerobaculia bacterium]
MTEAFAEAGEGLGAEAVQGFRASSQQRRLWALGGHGSLAVAEVTLSLSGPLDRARLRRAFEALVARHEILRTRFVVPPGLRYPLQVIDDGGSVQWEEGAVAVRPGIEPPGLSGGGPPPVGARLLADGPGEHRLAVRLPALAADGRTLDNLTRELAALYGLAGSSGDLEEPLQYADFAAWQ